MSTLLNTESTYVKLQPFAHIDELNKNTIAVRELYADQLTPSTKEVLDVLHRYSCKYPGVCYLSKNSIAEMVGVSRRTVIRACNLLESLGIISQHELKRHNGDKRQSSNAIVFVAVEKEDVTPECHTKEALANTYNSNSSNTNDTRNIDFVDKKEVVNISKEPKSSEQVKADLKRGLRDKMPTYLYDLLSPYFNLDDLYEAYGTLLRGKASIDKSIVFESHEGLFSDAVLSVINAYKRGKVRNLFAVLYTAAKDTTAQIYRKTNYKVENWLEW
jgi:Fe2+ or Zn2+ uptake regulation protein